MKSIRSSAVMPVIRGLLIGMMLVLPISSRAQDAAAKSPWTTAVGIEVRESYDDNVLLQDYGDQARRKSWVTSITPSLGATYQSNPALKAVLSYVAEVARFHAEPSENNDTQRFSANFSGQSEHTAWEVLNSAVWIEGNRYGPTYTGGSAVPALGGIPVRDRRDALILRNGFKVTQSFGPAFIRPMFSSYAHDFRTPQFNTAGYENYVNRQEFSGGLDAGYAVLPKTRVFLGYRLGRQEQSALLNVGSPYNNTYHRALLGAEGSPAGWLKFSLIGGPDFRTFSPGTPSGFSRRKTLYYYDASVTLTPSAQDTVSLASRRYAQPAFSSQSVYEDVVHDFTWKHKFGGKITAGAGFKIYAGLWLQPVQRRDYIYTSSLSLGIAICKGLSADLAYARDVVDSAVFNTSAREFKRHLISAGLKYSL
ncbi:MAG: hypothetical protein WC881_10355 [Elusimicrobiota bacterium]|jgi:hypothetical protein